MHVEAAKQIRSASFVERGGFLLDTGGEGWNDVVLVL